MRFTCPNCAQSMECSDTFAGKKAKCPKCGQKVLIPSPPQPIPPPSTKTTLGKLDDGSSPAQSATPVQPLPAASENISATPPTASLAPPPSENPASDSFAFDPPATSGKRKIPRVVWIVGAAGIGLFSCLFCSCAGISIAMYTSPTGIAIPFVRPSIVGKWEPANAAFAVFLEFNSDGNGAMRSPLFQHLQPTKKNNEPDFKWHVEGFKKPILVLDKTESKFFLNFGPWMAAKEHFYYAIEDDTLTLTPLTPGHPVMVLRRVK